MLLGEELGDIGSRSSIATVWRSKRYQTWVTLSCWVEEWEVLAGPVSGAGIGSMDLSTLDVDWTMSEVSCLIFIGTSGSDLIGQPATL